MVGARPLMVSLLTLFLPVYTPLACAGEGSHVHQEPSPDMVARLTGQKPESGSAAEWVPPPS